MVEHDSAIPPGRTGKVTQEVNLHGITGAFRKDLTVVSNAANEPQLRLYLKGTVRAHIEMTQRYLELAAPVARTAMATVTMRSSKGDLKVRGVIFRLAGSGLTDQPQTAAPVPVRHELKRIEGKDTDGLFRYELTLIAEIASATTHRGAFEIATNHPRKPLVEINGAIRAQ